MSSDAGGDSASTPVPLRHESVTSGGFKSGTLTWRIENFLARLDFAEVTGEKTLRSNSLNIVFGESKKGQFKDDLVSFRLEIRWNPPGTGRNNGGQENDSRSDSISLFMCSNNSAVPYTYHLYVVSSRGGYKWKSHGAESGFDGGNLRVMRGNNGWKSFCSKEELRRDASQYISEGAATFVCKFMVRAPGEDSEEERATERAVHKFRNKWTLGQLLWEKDDFSDVTILCVQDAQQQQEDGGDDIQGEPSAQPPSKRVRSEDKPEEERTDAAGPSRDSEGGGGGDLAKKTAEKNKEGEFVMSVFHCHRLVLKTRSNVFRAMFSHSPGMVAEEREGKIRITDISPRAVRDMLEFMYKDTLPMDLTLQRAADLLQAADKYGVVGSLKDQLEEEICDMVNMSNVGSVLTVAEAHGAEFVKEHIVKFLARATDFDSQLSSGWFRNIPGDIVKRVLEERSVSAVGAVRRGSDGSSAEAASTATDN